MRSISLLFLLFIAGTAARAQEPEQRSPWGSAYLGGGAFTAGTPVLVRGDLFTLAPNSALLGEDLSDHSFYSDTYSGGEGVFDLSIGLHPFQHGEKRGPELRMGFLYTGGLSIDAQLSKTEHVPWDTLVSSQTGQQIFVDSVHYSTYDVNYTAQRFGLNASLVWRRPARWCVYGGVGIMGGVILNASTAVTHYRSARTESTDDGFGFGYYPSRESSVESETFHAGSGWWLGIHAPLGIDFRISRKDNDWGRVHLCYEFRPQVVFQDIPELRENTGFGVQAVFLLRYEL